MRGGAAIVGNIDNSHVPTTAAQRPRPPAHDPGRHTNGSRGNRGASPAPAPPDGDGQETWEWAHHGQRPQLPVGLSDGGH